MMEAVYSFETLVSTYITEQCYVSEEILQTPSDIHIPQHNAAEVQRQFPLSQLIT